MAIKENLQKWTAAMDSFDKLDLEKSLDQFRLFAETSKVYFNVGIVAQRLRFNDQAIDAFSDAISMDSFFVAAYFQRGVLLFWDDDMDGALEDFQDAIEKLRGNTHIDYTQIGLEYVLQECYIMLNIALCYIALGEFKRGLKYMDQALQSAQSATIQPDVSKIEAALRNGKDADGKVLPYEIPESLIFRPQKDNIKNAYKVDYLGKSKIVVGADKFDNFNGFSGRQQKELVLGKNYRRKRNSDNRDQMDMSPSKLDTITRRHSLSRRPSNAESSLERRPSNESKEEGDGKISPKFKHQKRPTIGRRSSSITKELPNSVSISKDADIFRDNLMDTPPLDSYIVKAYFDECRIVNIKIPYDATYEILLNSVCIKLRKSNVFIKYRDEEGRKIIMANDEDLAEAIDLGSDGMLEVWCFVRLLST